MSGRVLAHCPSLTKVGPADSSVPRTIRQYGPDGHTGNSATRGKKRASSEQPRRRTRAWHNDTAGRGGDVDADAGTRHDQWRLLEEEREGIEGDSKRGGEEGATDDMVERDQAVKAPMLLVMRRGW